MDEEEQKEIVDEPIQVILKEKEAPKTPNFDYDDYTPSANEILETEKEIQENIEKRTKHGTK